MALHIASRRTPILALLIAVVAAAAKPAAAQDAIVLGGGGARGLAHAGVLVGLDRRGVQPTIVVGTSIGAIVGALYAAGVPADSVWRIIEDNDWPTMFQPMAVPIGADRQFYHPMLRLGADEPSPRFLDGLIAEWQINRTLARALFEPGARARGDFDVLPRRFRVVTVDFERDELVVLADGDLARAVRASMAVPGAFAPIEDGRRILVDGGLKDYLPIGVARALGAERVFAADVIRPPLILDDYDPVESITRAVRLLILNARRDTASADVLIVPDIAPNVSSLSFPRDPAGLFQLGLDATLAAVGPQATTVPAPQWRVEPPASLGGIVIDAPDRGLTALVERTFAGTVPGAYDPAAVLKAVDRLYATGLFHGIWPHVTVPTAVGQAVAGDEPVPTAAKARRQATSPDAEPAANAILVVRADAPAPRYVLGAAGYDNDRGGRVWAQVRQRLPMGAPAELSLGGSVDGLESWVAFAARRYSLALANLAWTAGTAYQRNDVRVFAEDTIRNRITVQRGGAWLGGEWRRIAPERFIVGLLRAEYVHTNDGLRGVSAGPMLRAGEPEQLGRLLGWPVRAEAEWRVGGVAYRQVSAGGSMTFGLGPLDLAPLADLTLVGGDAPADVLPALGDDLAIPGFRWGQKPGLRRAVAGVDVAYPIPFGGFARVRLRTGAVGSSVQQLRDGGAWVTGIGAGVFWLTPFGPIEAELGTNTDGEARLFINVGARF